MGIRALFAALLLGAACHGVHARVEWVAKDHDFGVFREQAGPQRGVSRFVNAGPDTVALFNVRPTCGCTSVEWDDSPVPPGDTVAIAYTYDPKMRPGKFAKHIKVQFSDGVRQSIRITGNVLGTPESLRTLYPVEGDGLRLSEGIVNAGTVTMGRTPVEFVNAYVTYPDSVIPSFHTGEPAMKVTASVKKAGPGDIVTYSLTLDTRKCGRYGSVSVPVVLKPQQGEGAEVRYDAFVVPDTDRLLRLQEGKNPVCDPLASVIDLGEIDASGGVVERELTVSNPGNAELTLLAVESDTPAVRIVKNPGKVKKGKKGIVGIEVRPGGLDMGPGRRTVTIVTDDPLGPVKRIPIAYERKK